MPFRSLAARLRSLFLCWLLPALFAAVPLTARDAYVLLSGGGTPLTNNYSQYLQARALAAFFEQNYPADSRWVFFGAGNRPGEPVVLADARKQYKKDGLVLESWLPGPLRDNRPATRESFLTALREEILPTVADGGTLYLFIGDHGELAKTGPKESIITMWQMKHDPQRPRGWFSDNQEVLGVTELQAVLREGLGQGRVVFCMTQCHSGGFHYLGVPRVVAPNTNWFTTVPLWAMPEDAPALPRAAGFTATDEESLAAGCDPDPDPEKWAGYERFIPEELLGLDLFTLEPSGTGLDSFAAAHEAATLVDKTIDKPRASSEQYLERWATLIEKLAGEPDLTPELKAQVAAYAQAVDTGAVQANEARLRERVEQFARFTTRLTEQNPAVTELLQQGTRAQLEEAMGPAASRPGTPGASNRRGPREDLLQAWNDTLRPAWKTAVLAGEVAELPAEALAFEKRLLAQEDNGRQLMIYRGWQNPLLNEIFWNSGYAFPDTLDVGKAETIARWGAERRGKILAWGEQSADAAVRAAAEKLAGSFGRRPPVAAPADAPAPVARTNVSTRPLSRKTAAERALFYRRVLAAWEFLIATDEQPALDALHALIELEHTPLPRARS